MRNARVHIATSLAAMVSASAAMLLAASCTREVPPASDARDVIELRWLKAYPRESRSDVETGLKWGLSLLGARLPAGSPVIRWHGERISVDLARAEVLEGTEPAWRQLIAAMKASGEYQSLGALDVGRFMALTLGSPNHYYALTGAPERYTNARARYQFEARPAAIVRSAVAHGGRRIDISVVDRVEQIAFVAFEGRGSFAEGTFVPQEIEVLDIMPNGQLRFALYGLDGLLKQAASDELTRAGKPAKCMWCHESGLHATLLDFPGVGGYYDRREFDALIARRRELLQQYRDGLDTQINYRDRKDHTSAELLYLTFEQPSRERLAREWGVSAARAGELLRGKATHAHEEFPYLGSELYRREEVDVLAPYTVLAAPQSVREASGYEPDIIGVRP